MKPHLDILKALSDMNRLRIISVLSRHDELCACQIIELLQVSGATASRHLRILQQAELVDSRKEGRWIYYRLVDTELKNGLLKWLKAGFGESAEAAADLKEMNRILSVTRETLCRMQRGTACCPE